MVCAQYPEAAAGEQGEHLVPQPAPPFSGCVIQHTPKDKAIGVLTSVSITSMLGSLQEVELDGQNGFEVGKISGNM